MHARIMLRLARLRNITSWVQQKLPFSPLSSQFAPPIVFKDLKSLQKTHALLIQTALVEDSFYINRLINAYAENARLEDAILVFEHAKKTNIFIWNSVIRWAYLCGFNRVALDYFYRLLDHHEAIKFDVCSVKFALRACFDLGSVEDGVFIHRQVYKIDGEMLRNFYVCAEFIHMYGGLGCIDSARQVFDEMSERNEVVWSLMISKYIHNGYDGEAMSLFSRMRYEGFSFNSFIMVSLIGFSASLIDLSLGSCIHGCAIKSGLAGDSFVRTSLVDMYVKCGCINDAYRVLGEVLEPNIATWNSIISGSVNRYLFGDAVRLFKKVQLSDLRPNLVTMLSLISACAGLGSGKLCRCIHSFTVKLGIDTHLKVGNALLEMYSSIGAIDDVSKLFNIMQVKDVISWTTMINMYGSAGCPVNAMQFFWQMRSANVEPDMVSMVALLSACAVLGDIQKLKIFHNQIILWGLEFELHIGNSLISVYFKCGDMQSAEMLFSLMSQKSQVTWGAMIAGYIMNGQAENSMRLMIKMVTEDQTNKMDAALLVNGLSAIADLANLALCKQVHAYMITTGLEECSTVQNALISAYSKCGVVVDARKVFDKMNQKDTVSWNAIISGHGINGDGESAVSLYQEMGRRNEVQRDSITYTSILNVCSHAGLVDEGLNIFSNMVTDAVIKPEAEHYACVVDMLARAGRLSEAEKFVTHIVEEPSSSLYGAFLSGCRLYGHVNFVEHVVHMVPDGDPADPGHSVLLSNIYTAASMFDEAAKHRFSMKIKGLMKKPGMSVVQTCYS
ncbi:putative pentatricopeptide repeat-containing protein At3g01580 [Nymphaea colorata]|nr:putative pentatricopeptide repeat-containing protein At3g01580 [Nymphaea colorata]